MKKKNRELVKNLLLTIMGLGALFIVLALIGLVLLARGH